MTFRPPRVLVVQSEKPERRDLKAALNRAGYAVSVRDDSLGIEEDLCELAPDLAVIDTRLRKPADGLDFGRDLRRGGRVGIIFVGCGRTRDECLAAFEAGGDDFIERPFALPEFMARVRALLIRAGKVGSGIRETGDILVDEERSLVTRSGNIVDLSPTEFDLLALLVRHTGDLLSKPWILSELWGGAAWDNNLVEVHVSALRQKLEAHGPRVIQTVRGVGYVFRPHLKEAFAVS